MFERMDYKPGLEQQAIHYDPSRIKLVSGGEQGGKSKTSGMELAGSCLRGKLFWICADSYEMTETEFFYCLEGLQAIEIKENIRLIDSYHWSSKDKSHIRLAGNSVTILTKSLKEAIKVAMTAPDGVVVCEADQIAWPTIQRILMRTTRSQGWVLLAGTYESSFGWQALKWAEWQRPNNLGAKSFSLPTWSNLTCFPGGRSDPKITQWETELSPGKFMERYGGIPCPPTNLVVPEFRSDFHVVDMTDEDGLTYNPDLPVELAVDPGYRGAFAVEMIQVIDGTINVFDEIYARGVTIDGIIRGIKQKPYCQLISKGAVDVAGNQHQAMTSVVEVFAQPAMPNMEGGMGIWLASQKIPENESIERLRTFFHVDPVNNKPKIKIHSGCKGLISELGGCKGPFENSGPWLNKVDAAGHFMGPMDKSNHAAKALAYWLVNTYGYTRTPGKSHMSVPDSWYKW